MDERDEKGRFVTGYSGGPGRPRKVIEAAYLEELLDVVTVEMWRGICKRAVADALKGSSDARRWLSEYIIGKPAQAIDLHSDNNTLLAAEWIVIRTVLLEALLPYPEARQRVAEALKKAEDAVDSD